MPRRELLTPTERLQLLAFPEDPGELIRVLTLSKVDIAFVRQHRGDSKKHWPQQTRMSESRRLHSFRRFR
jgi:hypothetical protein